jgi:hypothetical protein
MGRGTPLLAKRKALASIRIPGTTHVPVTQEERGVEAPDRLEWIDISLSIGEGWRVRDILPLAQALAQSTSVKPEDCKKCQEEQCF